MRKALIYCGILGAAVQVMANVLAPLASLGYVTASQTVSELSAIGAPTRGLWLSMMLPYSILIAGFSIGVWLSANGSRALRIAAICGFLAVIIGAFWPPMHQRGAEFTLTDTLHIAWTAIVVPLMMLQIGFAAAAFGRAFRVYSVLTIAAMIGFGVLTAIDAPNIASNGPTPLIGVWERIGIAAQIVWLPVFAIKLLNRNTTHQ